MAASGAFYVTTPIYYVNDSPHIGHAYTTLACDALARFMRLDGRAVHFLTGTDEHGQKVEKAAADAGLDPQTFTDRVSQRFRDLAVAMNCSNDDFIRTTEERHKRSVAALWERLIASGDIYLGKYAGWYSVRDEAFYAESELVGGAAPTGAPVEWVEEPSYFFKLSAWQDRLLEFYRERPDFVLPATRMNEVTSFVKGGLQDLSVSRTTFAWGIPVPGDPAHVMYVWLDALANYISALGFPDTEGELYRTFWPANFHVVGKDILRFHAVYWPAFLMSAGLEPPKQVFAHGWWTVEGQKMSKSLGNVVSPASLIEKYGLDQTRYFLLREIAFGSDGDFSHAAMVRRINHDLANDYGNLAQRVLSMMVRYFDGVVPEPDFGLLSDRDRTLLQFSAGLWNHVSPYMVEQRPLEFSRALEAIWDGIGNANQYVDSQAPWELRKTNLERLKLVLWLLAAALRFFGTITQPFMPGASAKLLDMIKIPESDRTFAIFPKLDVRTPQLHWLRPGTLIEKPEGLFPRHVESETA